MKTSPIQLLQLMFKSVHVEIDPAHAPPEPTNLEVPPHRYMSDALLLIGADDSGVA